MSYDLITDQSTCKVGDGPGSIEPAIFGGCGTVAETFGGDIFGPDVLPGLHVSSFVVKHHPRAQQESQQTARGTKNGSGNQSWEVFGCVLVLEDVGTLKRIMANVSFSEKLPGK
jgi:hypothetical protein